MRKLLARVRRLRLIRPGRYYSAHTPVFLFFLILIAGLGLLLGAPNPASIEAFLAPALVKGWAAALTIGSGLGVLGMVWRGHYVTSMVLEQIGQQFMGAVAVVFTIAIWQVAPPGGTTAAILIFGFALHCLLRAQAIRRHLKALTHTKGE